MRHQQIALYTTLVTSRQQTHAITDPQAVMRWIEHACTCKSSRRTTFCCLPIGSLRIAQDLRCRVAPELHKPWSSHQCLWSLPAKLDTCILIRNLSNNYSNRMTSVSLLRLQLSPAWLFRPRCNVPHGDAKTQILQETSWRACALLVQGSHTSWAPSENKHAYFKQTLWMQARHMAHRM